jgi:histidinol dehydrogenase
MAVAPARLAGVQEILVVTPPRPDGGIDPAVAAAAKMAGATAIVRAGGAQGIAAVAFGTKSVPRVDAIVGPGNAYVTAAKQAVRDHVRIDMDAGPSELLVVADARADAHAIALDLVAQAEHDPDAQVLLVTPDAGLAARVREAVAALLPNAPRRAIIEASLRAHGALLVVRDLDAAFGFADDYAPEHLAIMTSRPRDDLARVHSAGSVFLGAMTPVSLGDYGSGTNHILPTMGAARLRGGLCVEDFVRWTTWQQATRKGLQAIAPDITTVARAEGLVGHAEAVEGRL